MCKMKNKKNILSAMLVFFGAVILLSVFFTKQQTFASWIEEEEGKKYETEDGELAIGFSEIDGKRYYFDENGCLLTGKFYVEEESAYYYANKKGVVQTGIVETKSGFYVLDDSGKIQTGFVEYENNRYYFNTKAEMETGWFKVDGSWYYAGDTGVLMTGFLTLEGYRYYLGTDGIRVSDTVMEIDGVTYIFNKDGSIDENATTLYPVYQYFNQVRADNGFSAAELNPKVQACAILRASGLTEGYGSVEAADGSVETLLKNRGVMSNGGYEFSYGGTEGYGIEQLLSDIRKDINIDTVLKDESITGVGLGLYEKDNIYYYDIIFIYGE